MPGPRAIAAGTACALAVLLAGCSHAGAGFRYQLRNDTSADVRVMVSHCPGCAGAVPAGHVRHFRVDAGQSIVRIRGLGLHTLCFVLVNGVTPETDEEDTLLVSRSGDCRALSRDMS